MASNASILRLDAGHTTSGNPRRVFVRLVAGAITHTWDEGYRGKDSIPVEHRSEYVGTTLSTTPSEYRDLLKTNYLPR